MEHLMSSKELNRNTYLSKNVGNFAETIKIGDCELDVPSGVVVNGDRSTRLDPKSVDVAIYLAEHADELVTRDQLLESVWPNKFVTESQLSKRITEISGWRVTYKSGYIYVFYSILCF